jgi:hypothetical protein
MTLRATLHALKVTAAVTALLYAIAHSPGRETSAGATGLARRPVAVRGAGPR